MKTCFAWLITFVLLIASIAAQERPDSGVDKEAKLIAETIVERGPHHAVHQRITSRTTSYGKTYLITNSYTELATGMHYRKDGQWVESKEEIEIFDGAAVARQGPINVIFAANLNSVAAIDLSIPDAPEGKNRFRSHVVGLAYTDYASGRSVMIAEVKDSIGAVSAPNKVIYRDAFAGDCQADVRYTYTRNGFEQDIILLTAPPSPAEWGLNPETTRLEVFTEFVEAPEALVTPVILKRQENLQVRQRMAEPDLVDQQLNFGSLQFGPGYAFPLESRGDPFDENTVPTGKSFQRIDGRLFLIEKVDYQDIRQRIGQLPKAAAVRKDRKVGLPGHDRAMMASILPARPKGERGKWREAQYARLEEGRKGFVLDYVSFTSESLTNYTFKSDTSYFIAGACEFYGATVMEGLAVLKYNTNASVRIRGSLECRTAPGRPLFLTGKDDNTLGEIISGSTGTPTNRYGSTEMIQLFDTSLTYDLHDIRATYGYRAITLAYQTKANIRNIQVANGWMALGQNNSTVINCRNFLFYDLVQHSTITTGGNVTNRSEHGTMHRVTNFRSTTSTNGYFTLTNCLLIAVTNQHVYEAANVVTNFDDTGYFQTVGAGAHYLINGSTHRDAGTTNINPELLVALKTKTTFPPNVLSGFELGHNTNLAAVVARDADIPDIGYHYEPIDWLVGGIDVDNATLTVSNGAVVAIDAGATNYGFGIRLVSGATLISEGSPTNFNRFVRNNAVQESPVGDAAVPTPMFADVFPAPASPTAIRSRFTEFSLTPGAFLLNQERGRGTLTTLSLRDSEIRGGKLYVSGSQSNMVTGITNCLFDRVKIEFYDYVQSGNSAFNNTFHEGTLLLTIPVGGIWTWRDNLFDKGTNVANIYGTFTYDHNGYVAGYGYFTNATDTVLTNSPAYETFANRGFYLPANSPLLNAGSRNATNAALYHYTTTTVQTKEGTTQVDIGYHRVAVGPNDQPLDSDYDGTPDFAEDANGNGVTDTGETCFHDPILTVAATVDYIKGSPPKLLDTNAVVLDAGSPDFGGGRLTVSVITNATPQERLGIRHQGTGTGQIGISGTNLTYDGTTIGNYSGGVGTNALLVNFNTNASLAAVQGLMRCLTFQIASNNPAEIPHTLKFYLTDGDGGTNAPTFQTVNVVCPTALDVMLVLDISNSLSDTNFFIAKQAASNFVSQLNLDPDRVGLVSFASNATLNAGLTTNGTLLQSNILQLTKQGGTRFGPPFDTARTNLPTSSSNNVLPLIVFFSDGQSGGPGDDFTNRVEATNACITAKDAGIRVISVAYGTNSGIDGGTNLMKWFASSDSDFYYAPSAAQMQDVYTSVAQSLCRGFPPTVALTAPTNGSVFIAPATFTLEATASDSDGTVTKVEFLANGTEIGEDASPPFTFNWSGVSAGVRTLTAIATDNTGLMATSSVVTVTVDAPPTVTITSPTNGSNFISPSSIVVTANAADSDGTVSRVEFFNFATNKIGEVASSPFTINWQNPQLGTNRLTAIATDNYGARATSAEVQVTVLAAPSITILNPTSNTTFAAVMNLLVRAAAQDADGWITNVLFYTNGVAGLNVTNPPFRFPWTNLPTGSYQVFAKAWDNHNLSNTSAAVSFTVSNCPQVGVSNLILIASTVPGGSNVTATITLSNAAPAGGQVVALTCADPNVSIPASVFVPGGTNRVTFRVDTFASDSGGTATLTATTPVSTNAVNLTIQASSFQTLRSPGQCGPLDVVFIFETGYNAGAIFTAMRSAMTNLVNSDIQESLAFASGGDYRVGLVTCGYGITNCSTLGPQIHVRLNLTNDWASFATSVTNVTVENNVNASREPRAWDEALNTVVNGLSADPSRTNSVGCQLQVNDFSTAFRPEARKLIFLATDDKPGGIDNVFTPGIDDVNGHLRSVQAGLKGIQISVIQARADSDSPCSEQIVPEVVPFLVDCVETTGGIYLVPTNHCVDATALFEQVVSRCGVDWGEAVITRDDLRRWNHSAITLNNGQAQAASHDPATFDLSGVEGPVVAANFQRTGQLRVNHGSHFSFDLGIGSVTDPELAFFAPPSLAAQVTPLGSSYTTNWPLPFRFHADIQSYLGAIYPVELVDRVSSICGNNFEVVDTPQSDWPAARNTLTFKTLAGFEIPQGRCRDFVLTGTNAPCGPCGASWEIRLYDEVIASACLPKGWSVESDHGAYGGVNICAPADALTAIRYEVRFLEGGTNARSGYFSVIPAGMANTAPVLKPLELSLPTCSSNTTVTVTVALDAPAQGPGAFVSLTVSGLVLSNVPPYVHIPAGETAASFTFRPPTVATNTPFQISASYNGLRKANGRAIEELTLTEMPVVILANHAPRQILISWNQVPGALFYELLRSGDGYEPFAILAQGLTRTCFVDENPIEGENCYLVRPANSYDIHPDGLDGVFANDCTIFTRATPLRPRILPHGGRFNDVVDFTITCESTNAIIWFRTDGIPPSPTDGVSQILNEYNNPYRLTADAQVVTRAFFDGNPNGSLDDRADFHISQPQMINCGDTIVSSLATTNQPSAVKGFGWYGARYGFHGRRGDRVNITVLSQNFDADLNLRDANGVVVAENDLSISSGLGIRPAIQHTLRTNGLYFFEVTSANQGVTGNFSVHLDCEHTPELDVFHNNVELPNESTLDFGLTNNGSLVSRTITLTNSGSTNLILGTLNISPSQLFSVSPANVSSIPTNGFTNLVLTFNAASNGPWSGVLWFDNDDSFDDLPGGDYDYESPYVVHLEAFANPPGVAPTVTITNISNGEVLTTPPAVFIGATNTVTNTASITQVVFYATGPAGKSQIGVDTSGPQWAINWNNAPPGGTYVLTARATDSVGRIGISPPVTITNNNPPVARDDAITVAMNTTSDLNVLANDTDPNGNAVMLTNVFSPTLKGTASITDGVLYYTPSNHVFGRDSLRYVIADLYGARSTGNVSILIQPSGQYFTNLYFNTTEIRSPSNHVEIIGPSNVIGTASSDFLDSWKLEYRRRGEGPSVWTLLSSATTNVSTNLLGVFDPTSLPNGQYDLRVTLTDLFGSSQDSQTTLLVTENHKIGHFTLAFTDLQIPVSGLPITLTRTYDSRVKEVGDFGVGWNLDVSSVRLEKSGIMGEGWTSQIGSGAAGIIHCLQEEGLHLVSIVFPDGKVFRFLPVLDVNGGNDPCEVTGGLGQAYAAMRFVPAPGTLGTLRALTPSPVKLRVGFTDVGHPVTLNEDRDDPDEQNLLGPVYDPQEFEFTTRDGRRFYFNAAGKVTLMIDRAGNSLEFRADGIIHTNSGKSVKFLRDAAGRITEIFDPIAQLSTNNPQPTLQYKYDGAGNLIDVLRLTSRNATNPAYVTTQFGYENTKYPHYLTSIVDPRGVTGIRNEYGDDGRLKCMTDASGKTINYVHSESNKTEIIVDRLGNTNVLRYDAKGNVTNSVNALGHTNTYAFDANNNKTREVIAGLLTNAFTFDANNLLTESVVGGLITNKFTYNKFGQMLAALDGLGRGTTNAYDALGNLLATTNALGFTNGFTYDANGNLLTSKDALGTLVANLYDQFGNLTNMVLTKGSLSFTNSFAYDANGNRVTDRAQRTLPSGQFETLLTTLIYDAQNRVTATVDALGHTNQVAFNEIGKQEEVADKLGRITRYEYDLRGNLSKVTHPDNTSEQYAYDAEGRRTNTVDRAGRSTTSVYDALGRLVQTIYPDNTSTRTGYDDAGRVAWTMDARGFTNWFAYDAAGRRTAVTNALGQVSRSQYDSVGNLTNTIDALNHSISYTYDALNQRIRMTFPDGTTQSTLYDELNRRVGEVDPAGVTNRFGYDGLGRLVAVTNAWATPTATWSTYAHDENGNQTNQVDALGRKTLFQFDSLGRRVARILPGGQIEGFFYDNGGNLLRHTNFNGQIITNHYDSMDRLLGRWHGSTNLESYSYSPTGQRAVATNESGAQTFAYDLRGRLITNTTPAGTLVYAYDANGNLTNTVSSTANGVSVGYQYDALNRLTNVIDNRLGLAAKNTAYTFDAVGNLTALNYPNGVTNQWQYDSLNRLTNEVWKLNTTTLASFFYKLGPSGIRTNLTDTINGTARTFSWSYDSLYRLTNETINGAAPTGTLSYKLDAVGNRTNRTSSISGILTTNNYFDVNDWLDADSTTNNGSAWFDRNGNTRTNGTTVYLYDWANRLTNTTSVTSIAYDANGNRVKKVVGSTTRLYLVSTVNPSGYAQVMEELTVSGGATNLACAYVYGLDLISQRQPGVTTNFYGYDGLGSVRFLLNLAGGISDTYAYDAWGNLITNTGTIANLYLFAGEQFDFDLKLYYNRARTWDPNVGRFMTRDTHEGDSSDPLSLHKYLYSAADTVNHIDPSGHDFTAVGMIVANSIAAGMQTLYDEGVVGSGMVIQERLLESLKEQTVAELFAEALSGDSPVDDPLAYVTARLEQFGVGANDAESYAFREYFDFSLLPLLVEDPDYVTSDLDEQDVGDAEPQCFVAGTKILTLHGFKRIEAIKSGERVWAYDTGSSNAVIKEVLETFIRERTELRTLRVDEDVIEVTPEHPFFVRGKGWTRADALREGDALLTYDKENEAHVRHTDKQVGKFTVYNFEVEECHNYFVADEAVLVHNLGRGYHHFVTRGLGSRIPYGDRILRKAGQLSAYRHTHLHKKLNNFLRRQKTSNGLFDMMPRNGNPGRIVRQNFSPQDRMAALAKFYRSYEGGKYYRHFRREVSYLNKNPGLFR